MQRRVDLFFVRKSKMQKKYHGNPKNFVSFDESF
jgi:hypothetical protein